MNVDKGKRGGGEEGRVYPENKRGEKRVRKRFMSHACRKSSEKKTGVLLPKSLGGS